MIRKVLLWLQIIRPQTLFASACPVLVGLLLCDRVDWPVGLATLLCALSLQILSNLINDYYDYRRGADKAGRLGFRRALAEGLVSERQMLAACLVALGVSVALGGCLVLVGGWPILLVGLTAILFAWLYTATSHSLSYLGIADVFVFLYYGVIATAGTVWLQGAGWQWQAFWAGAVCGLLSMCVLIANNLRDMDDDRRVGKRTFPVRMGKRAGEAGYVVIVCLTPLCAWLAFGLRPAVLVIVPGLLLIYKLLRASGREYNVCLLMAGITNLIYVVLVALS